MTQPKNGVLSKAFLFSIVLICLFNSPLFAEDNILKEQARDYRSKGYEAQKSGLLVDAISYYQKAISIDPYYVCAYNDLGVVYEMLGDVNAAESVYLRALKIDSKYPGTYSNIAMLYEKKGNLLEASKYWIKRLNFGDQDDHWTKKAQSRLFEIGQIIPRVKEMYLEAESDVLADQVLAARNRSLSAQSDVEEAAYYIESGNEFFKRKKYTTALKMYNEAKRLDPSNDQIDASIELTLKRLLQ